MYRQKSYRQACSVKRPHVSERFHPRRRAEERFHPRSPGPRAALDGRTFDLETAQTPLFDSTVGGNVDDGMKGSFK